MKQQRERRIDGDASDEEWRDRYRWHSQRNPNGEYYGKYELGHDGVDRNRASPVSLLALEEQVTARTAFNERKPSVEDAPFTTIGATLGRTTPEEEPAWWQRRKVPLPCDRGLAVWCNVRRRFPHRECPFTPFSFASIQRRGGALPPRHCSWMVLAAKPRHAL